MEIFRDGIPLDFWRNGGHPEGFFIRRFTVGRARDCSDRYGWRFRLGRQTPEEETQWLLRLAEYTNLIRGVVAGLPFRAFCDPFSGLKAYGMMKR